MHKQIYLLALLASFGACQAALAADPDMLNFEQPQLPAEAANGVKDDIIAAITHPPTRPPASDHASDVVRGFHGNGQRFSSTSIPALPALQNERNVREQPPVAAPQEFGASLLPYSTARADQIDLATNTGYPYRAAGKLFMLGHPTEYRCSASLIKPGIVVTAAHCVAQFGSKDIYPGLQFAPAYRNDNVKTPYNLWSVQEVFIPDSWTNGTDACVTPGVACENDVAVLVLQGEVTNGFTNYAGDSTGWLSYASTSAMLTPTSTTHLTELGYPDDLDNGYFMERNDTQGAIVASAHNNLAFGSLMSKGSSGGPLVVNFGMPSEITGGPTIHGQAATPNTVVGVVSWGATLQQWQGASQFTDTNIKALLTQACTKYTGACWTIKILLASYGAGSQLSDVSGKFQGICDGTGYCTLPINSMNMGSDPAPGISKNADYQYFCSTAETNYSVQTDGSTPEGQTATLSCNRTEGGTVGPQH